MCDFTEKWNKFCFDTNSVTHFQTTTVGQIASSGGDGPSPPKIPKLASIKSEIFIVQSDCTSRDGLDNADTESGDSLGPTLTNSTRDSPITDASLHKYPAGDESRNGAEGTAAVPKETSSLPNNGIQTVLLLLFYEFFI